MTMYRWEMRDRLTGEVRSSVEEMDASWESIDYIWTEGNQSCDANRGAAFYECSSSRFGGSDDKHDCLQMPDGTQRFELLKLEVVSRSTTAAAGTAGSDAGEG